MPHTKTVLRYPGGKSRVFPFISSVIEDNNLNDAIYIEPYAGSAGVAINLLFDNSVKKVIINDLDIHIYSFWKSILKKTDNFLRLIKDKRISISEWERQKNVFLHPADYPIEEVGFSTFYLNRCNRSGILNGGIIGGRNQLGKYKMGARFNKNNLSKKIKKISLYASKIEVFKKDALTILKRFSKKKGQYFIYLDPPYYHKSNDLYYSTYKESDHKKLSSFLKKDMNFFWILSYDNCKEIRKLYKKNEKKKFKIKYSLNKKTVGEELMIFDSKLKIEKNNYEKLVEIK